MKAHNYDGLWCHDFRSHRQVVCRAANLLSFSVRKVSSIRTKYSPPVRRAIVCLPRLGVQQPKPWSLRWLLFTIDFANLTVCHNGH